MHSSSGVDTVATDMDDVPIRCVGDAFVDLVTLVTHCRGFENTCCFW